MAKKIALGKGIASLLGETNPNVRDAAISKNNNEERNFNSSTPYLISVDDIKANPDQPRKTFNKEHIAELAESIKENGIIQPLIVEKVDGGFRLIAGERRFRAAKLINLSRVPVIIKRATDKERMLMGIIENVQREDLNCVEEALAYFQLMNDFNLTQEEVSKKIGKDRSSIANHLRLLKLPRDIVSLLQMNKLSFGHGKVLASVKEKSIALECANICIEENLSIRDLEALVKSKSRKKSPNKTNDSDSKNSSLDKLRKELESKTGFHFKINHKSNDSGKITIVYNDKEEFNTIFDYLMK